MDVIRPIHFSILRTKCVLRILLVGGNLTSYTIPLLNGAGVNVSPSLKKDYMNQLDRQNIVEALRKLPVNCGASLGGANDDQDEVVVPSSGYDTQLWLIHKSVCAASIGLPVNSG